MCAPISPRINFMPIHITVNIHNRMWTEGTYCPRLQADSSRVECDTFPDESEGLSRWVGGAFIVTTHSSSFIVRYARKITERRYISSSLADSEIPWVTDRNVRYS
jgi:hypothetical protein